MRTHEQQNASRINGARSNGPVTPEGKAASSQNRTTHGLFSAGLLLRPESQQGIARLENVYIARFKPADEVELSILHDMAIAKWREQRAIAMEAALINIEYDDIARDEGRAASPDVEVQRAAVAYARAIGRDKAVLELGRQSVRLGRYWLRLHAKYKELQHDRVAEERALQAAEVAAAKDAETPQAKRGNEPGVVELPVRQPVAQTGLNRPDAVPSLSPDTQVDKQNATKPFVS